MTSRACRLGPFERLPPVMGDTLSFGGGDAKGRDESRRAVDAPIVIVDREDRQASVVHARPLRIAKKGRTFLFGKPRHQPVRAEERAGRVQVDSVSASDGTVTGVDDDTDTWVTLIGPPSSLFGDVVYEALTSPWENDASSSIGLLLKGRLEATPAGSATLFGEWTGPGASVAAELLKEVDSSQSRVENSRGTSPASASEDRGRKRGRERDRSLPLAEEIFFITDEK